MENYFSKVKEYINELNLPIIAEIEEEGIIVIKEPELGIYNMAIDVEEPILVIEQFLIELKNVNKQDLIMLLKKNREMVHGAFVLDDSGTKLLFRDTLQLENLDLNELEASINSLSLLLSEFSEQLIKISKQ